MWKQDYDHHCDLWSCGIIAFLLLCSYLPFDGDDDREVLRAVMRASFSFPREEWDAISDDAKALITCLLSKAPRKRGSARAALDHPWFASKNHARAPPVAERAIFDVALESEDEDASSASSSGSSSSGYGVPNGGANGHSTFEVAELHDVNMLDQQGRGGGGAVVRAAGKPSRAAGGGGTFSGSRRNAPMPTTSSSSGSGSSSDGGDESDSSSASMDNQRGDHSGWGGAAGRGREEVFSLDSKPRRKWS